MVALAPTSQLCRVLRLENEYDENLRVERIELREGGEECISSGELGSTANQTVPAGRMTRMQGMGGGLAWMRMQGVPCAVVGLRRD